MSDNYKSALLDIHFNWNVRKIIKIIIKSLYLYSKLLCYCLNYYILETSSVYFDRILSRLAGCYPRAHALEELTALVIPPYNILRTFSQNIAAQRENQAKILDALILLEDQGYIVLNPSTDKSSITLKGLIKINNTTFCN